MRSIPSARNTLCSSFPGTNIISSYLSCSFSIDLILHSAGLLRFQNSSGIGFCICRLPRIVSRRSEDSDFINLSTAVHVIHWIRTCYRGITIKQGQGNFMTTLLKRLFCPYYPLNTTMKPHHRESPWRGRVLRFQHFDQAFYTNPAALQRFQKPLILFFFLEFLYFS